MNLLNNFSKCIFNDSMVNLLCFNLSRNIVKQIHNNYSNAGDYSIYICSETGFPKCTGIQVRTGNVLEFHKFNRKVYLNFDFTVQNSYHRMEFGG